ncbi:signal peptidase II [Haliea sp. E17]|uniref:signal peptidase II n=1 Tax=Haliea sp. E17 TaxID=3401576 RepID=UPI003AAC3095
MPERIRVLRWYVLALVVVLLDQYTKGLASAQLEYARPVPVFFWFDLTLHHNPGAAFSFLSDAGGWQRWFFTGIAVAMSVAIAAWLFFVPRAQWLLALGLGLILGGALGNLWDRVVLGHVVDFISVHWQGWYFPTFNLADSAITVGAGCLILDSFLHRGQEKA